MDIKVGRGYHREEWNELRGRNLPTQGVVTSWWRKEL